MLGKAIKHEFRATGRIMLPLYVIVLFVSCLARFAFRGLDNIEEPGMLLTFLMIITVVLFGVGLAVVAIAAVVLMARRFRVNILGDEGYLTMTLPMSVHSLLWSKLIVSLVWFLCTGAVITLSAIIVSFEVNFVTEMVNALGDMIHILLHLEGREWLLVGESLITTLLWSIAACLCVYAALAVGHGFARHKMALSVLAYVLMSSVLSWLTGALGGKFFLGLNYTTYDMIAQKLTSGLGWIILTGGLHCVLYYAVTVWNLKHRLNLE